MPVFMVFIVFFRFLTDTWIHANMSKKLAFSPLTWLHVARGYLAALILLTVGSLVYLIWHLWRSP
jgi:hypothetical protein